MLSLIKHRSCIFVLRICSRYMVSFQASSILCSCDLKRAMEEISKLGKAEMEEIKNLPSMQRYDLWFGRLGFDSRSGQTKKLRKIGISSFPTWRSALKAAMQIFRFSAQWFSHFCKSPRLGEKNLGVGGGISQIGFGFAMTELRLWVRHYFFKVTSLSKIYNLLPILWWTACWWIWGLQPLGRWYAFLKINPWRFYFLPFATV